MIGFRILVSLTTKIGSARCPSEGSSEDLGIADTAREQIRGDNGQQPDFDTAVNLHRLVDGIKEASDTGHEKSFM
jgi:hypothetical protein